MNVINNYIEPLLKNPLFRWLKWLITSRLQIFKNSKKHLCLKNFAYTKNCIFGYYNTFYENTSIINCEFKNFIYVGNETIISNAKIGNFCSISRNVMIGLGKHPTDYVSTFPAFFSIEKQCQISFTNENLYKEYEITEIGNDVWIGASAIILDGVKIGNGAIIGAGAVVTKDVEPYSIVGGIPARLLKKRFDDEIIASLQKDPWWEKDINWLRSNYKLFVKPSDYFISKNKN